MTPSVRATRIASTPDGAQPEIITIDFGGWIFPRSGVAFVWSSVESQPPPALEDLSTA